MFSCLGKNRALWAKIFNGVSFYVGWFACVALAAWGEPWWSIVVGLAFVFVHFPICDNWRRDLGLVVLMSILGFFLDTIYMALGVLSYRSPNPWVDYLAPLWLIPLYALFAQTLNSSLSYLRGNPFILSWLAALAGPLTYLAGERMGAASFIMDRGLALLFIGITWALFMPLMDRINTLLSNRLTRQ